MSQFGAEKFTTRSRTAIEAAQLAATTAGNTSTEPVHLLVALLRDAEGTAGTLVSKAGVDPRVLLGQAETVMTALPRATGSTVQQPGASAALTRVLAAALDLAQSMKDDYVASEHLLIALAGVEQLGAEGAQGRGPHRVRAARRADRGARQPAGHQPGRRVDLRSAGEVQRRPDQVRRGGQARSGHRPRRRDPPGDPGAVPAYEEQPGSDRRARRRQDRRRRGARPAGGRRRRARLPQGPPGARRSTWPRWWPARSTAASSRSGSRPCSRRSRTPAARSSRSSTSCTPSSARAPAATPRWTPATCSSRCWPAASCT